MDGVEVFIEYGISYRGEPPRAGTWTPNYEVAMRDLALRREVHGEVPTMQPIEVWQRTTTITSTGWSPAVRPDVEPVELQEVHRP